MSAGQAYLLVFLGGGLGAAARHGVNRASFAILGPAFPWGTLIVNVVGGMLMGALVGWLALRSASAEPMRLLLATGLLGGFTTFSAFSLDAILLWQRGHPWASAAYVAASVLLSIGGLLAGMAAVRSLA